MTKGPSIAALLREGRIERVAADRDAARSKLEESSSHLDSAFSISAADPTGAYALLYDAARKAIDAHMLANGYRVAKDRPGAHASTAMYVEAVLGRGRNAADVLTFDRMRRNRNRLEYGVWQVGASTVARDLEHARGIARAIREALQ